MKKIIEIHWFLPEILMIKESYNLIEEEDFTLKFFKQVFPGYEVCTARNRPLQGVSFQAKSNVEVLWKLKKTPFLPILNLFCSFDDQQDFFSRKSKSVTFLVSSLLLQCKIFEKTVSEKNQLDVWMGTKIDSHLDNHEFIGPPLPGKGLIKTFYLLYLLRVTTQ